MGDFDGLKVTVKKPSEGNFGTFYRGKIEEDVYHSAKLVRIEQGENSYKGKVSPAWVWIYELQGKEFAVKTDEGKKQAEIREKTSQKLTGAPRKSNAYIRYSQLVGAEPEPGDDINLKDLFDTVCKLMITNFVGDKEDSEGNKIVYHNIEKISVKGLKKAAPVEDDDDDDDEEPKKVVKKKKKKVVEEDDDDDDDEEPVKKKKKDDDDDDADMEDIF